MKHLTFTGVLAVFPLQYFVKTSERIWKKFLGDYKIFWYYYINMINRKNRKTNIIFLHNYICTQIIKKL